MSIRYPELFNALALAVVYHIFSYQWQNPGGLAPDLPMWPVALDESLGFVKHSVLLYIVFCGTTFGKYRWWFLVPGLTIVAGFAFRIQQWPLALKVYAAGFALLFLLYCIPFFRKRKKTPLDIAKFAWLLLFVASVIIEGRMGLIHQIARLTEILAFLALVLLFVLDSVKNIRDRNADSDVLDQFEEA